MPVRAATASIEFRALQQFVKWAVSEDEIATSSMARTRAPLVPDEPPNILTPEDLRRLLARVRVRHSQRGETRPSSAC